jgi:NADH-quinone oxidoreductase subunit L
VSQLGFMFLAMGVGAYAVGIFHLMTHAFFKALLFLGAGSVIHAMSGEQDLMKMGSLRSHIPTTFKTMLVGAIAIAGIPPLAGFFSKDEILWQAFQKNWVFWLVGIAAATMTAFYMFRLIFLAFYGQPRMDHHTQEHIHESPRSMTIPLIILAFLSVVGGWVGIPPALHIPSFPIDFYHWLEPVTGSPHATAEGAEHASASIEYLLMIASVAVAGAGIWFAYRNYVQDPARAERMAASFPGLHKVLYNKYYVDEIYNAVIIQPTKQLCLALAWFDLKVIDGIVNGSAFVTVKTAIVAVWVDINVVDLLVNLAGAIVNFFGGLLRRIQTGLVQNYGLISLYMFLILVAVYLAFYS